MSEVLRPTPYMLCLKNYRVIFISHFHTPLLPDGYTVYGRFHIICLSVFYDIGVTEEDVFADEEESSRPKLNITGSV